MKGARLLIGIAALILPLAASYVIADVRPRAAPAVNLIAFVDADGAVKTMLPDGSGVRRISPSVEGFFTWPTWSPDARTLAYSGVVNADGAAQLNLYAAALDGIGDDGDDAGLHKVIYAAEPGDVGLLAQGVIHYPLWSPDGTHLAFIAAASDGLSLYIDDLSDDPVALHLLDDGPLWMAWSDDGAALAVHRGSDHFLVDARDGFRVTELDIAAQGYRVPAWKPSANAITVLAGEGVATANLVDGVVEAPMPLRDARGEAAFLWSPSGAHLAVSDGARRFLYRGAFMSAYRRLAIASESAPQSADEIRQPILAFFWSPDGSRLAYITLSDTEGALRCIVVDMDSRERRSALDFVPSPEQQTLFQFFDQYAYSHSVWSPDSANLVFAGNIVGSAATASIGTHPGHRGFHIIVADADGASTPQLVGEGIMGFWSPR